jgi:hypothetical protein
MAWTSNVREINKRQIVPLVSAKQNPPHIIALFDAVITSGEKITCCNARW